MNGDPDRDSSVTHGDEAGQLEAMARAAEATFDGFHDAVVAIMTPERAAFVRYLRVEKSYSWRAVADACFSEWEPELSPEVRATWQPRSNQLMGMALCEVVAALEGQHHMKRGEWN